MMKKILLASAITLLTGTVMANVRMERPSTVPWQEAKAEGSSELIFRYSNFPEEAFNVPEATRGSSTLYAAVKMRHEDLVKYVGNSITAIVVTSGSFTDNYGLNPVSEIELFITKDLSEEPVRKQTADLMEYSFYDNRIELDEPYDLTEDDGDLYIGYSFLVPEGKTACYLVSDLSNDCATNYIVGISDDDSLPQTWEPRGLVDGSLCLGWVISGEHLPEDSAVVINSIFPEYEPTGGTGSYTLYVKNIGTNLINDYEVSTKIGNSESHIQKMELQWPIRSMSTVRHTIPDVPFNEEGFLPVEISITKVNGVPVENPAVFTSEALAYASGFDRNVLVEEFSGPTCGWCPAGYVLVEYANETYPGRMIAVVGQVNSDDQCEDYQAFIDSNVPSIPYTWFNRVSSEIPANIGGGTEYTFAVADNIFNKYDSYPSYCNVSAEATQNPETGMVDVKAESEFSIDMDRPHRFSFILTEDNIGPIDQLNNYAGGYYGTMDGWENEESNVSIMCDNVIRACKDVEGIEGSFPEKISKGEKITYSTSLPTDNTTGGALKVVALVTNALTGEVMNATRVDVSKGVGVESLYDRDAIRVYSSEGSIIVSGASDVKVFNMAGMPVSGTDNLVKGVYLVVADGKTFKVAIK